jgi:hypothetical protein
MKTMKCIFLLGLMFLAIPATYAKEGGDQYPNGAENWFAGATPPPGFYYINYFGYYTGELKNGSGNKANVGGTTPNVDATFNAFRFLEMTKFKIFGATWGMHVIVPVVYQSMNFLGTRSETSVADITIDPFVLGWHHPQWHAVAAIDINLPTGHYNGSDPRVSVGANYYSFEPLFAFSYMPKSGWEASAKLMYNIKTTNQATNYHSGPEFHADYLAGKHFGSWMFGATGYVLKQVTDDTVNGSVVTASPGVYDTGRRGQVFAVGPSIGYTNKSHMTFMVQWQHETLVENRFGGDKFWFKMIIPASSLYHKKSLPSAG